MKNSEQMSSPFNSPGNRTDFIEQAGKGLLAATLVGLNPANTGYEQKDFIKIDCGRTCNWFSFNYFN